MRHADIIQFLLLRDPDGASRATSNRGGHDLPLHLACDDDEYEEDLKTVKILFDSHPEDIVWKNSIAGSCQGSGRF